MTRVSALMSSAPALVARALALASWVPGLTMWMPPFVSGSLPFAVSVSLSEPESLVSVGSGAISGLTWVWPSCSAFLLISLWQAAAPLLGKLWGPHGQCAASAAPPRIC